MLPDAPAGLVRGAPLAPRTTLGVGGPARWLVEVSSEEALVDALAWADREGAPVLVLGGGSNLLVADAGFDGLVVRLALRGEHVTREGDTVVVRLGAGEPWDAFVARAVAAGWAGVECLAGIPGDTGATPIQNVGAYGAEVADTIREVRVVERATGRASVLSPEACGFSYRDSVFKREAAGRWIVTEVTFALRAGGEPLVRYPELARRLEGTARPTLAEVRNAVLALRRAKSMVLDPADENGRSAGSFFTNPIVDAESLPAIVERAAARAPGETMPRFPAPGGRTKLSAGWLIERAGFAKGLRDGAVGLSTRHALAIVTRPGATAADVVRLATRIRDGVLAAFGVRLVPEPSFVGFSDH